MLSGLGRLVARRDAPGYSPWQGVTLIRTPIAYLVGSVAAFWVVQRVVAFWP